MKRSSDYLHELAHSSDSFYELSDKERKILQSALLDMYKDIKDACDKNNIQVMLSGGSCIGAVRHHGFIPWDDDIDLMMAREDYDKFIVVLQNQLSDKYTFSVPRSGKPSIALLLNVFRKDMDDSVSNDFFKRLSSPLIIDVLPIERAPDNKFIRFIKFISLDLLRICVLSTNIIIDQDSTITKLSAKALKKTFCGSIHYYCRYVIGKIVNLIGRQKVIDFYDKFASSSKGKYYRTINTGRGMSRKECLPQEVFFPPRKMMFEDIESYVPNNIDRYLSNLYGDYMTLPPIEKRERHLYLNVENI